SECCPPNLVRFMASMPGFIYAQDKRGAIYVNLYVSSEVSFKVGGKNMSLSVDSQMPWDGKSRITVSANEAVRGNIKLRVPGWARNQPVPGGLYSYLNKSEKQTGVSINGKTAAVVIDQAGYISVDRDWNDRDVIEIEFPVEVRRVVAERRVRENRGRMCVEKGPIVFCAEWPDTPGGNVLGLLFD